MCVELSNCCFFFFLFNDTATTEIFSLSLHDALPSYFGTRNLWTLVAVHAAFNFLYAGPQLLAGNLQQTYVTGDPIDFVLLAVSTALLVPAAWSALRRFQKNSKNV